MVKRKVKATRKKCTCKKPTGVIGSVVSWVREKAGVGSTCYCS
jgi:hypothetical protein